MARREVERVSGEFWLYIRAELTKLRSLVQEPDTGAVDRVLSMAGDMHRWVRVEGIAGDHSIVQYQNHFYCCVVFSLLQTVCGIVMF